MLAIACSRFSPTFQLASRTSSDLTPNQYCLVEIVPVSVELISILVFVGCETHCVLTCETIRRGQMK